MLFIYLYVYLLAMIATWLQVALGDIPILERI